MRRANAPFMIAPALIIFAALGSLCGCDERSSRPSAVLPPPPHVDHPAIVIGRVTFAGAAPDLPRLGVAGDSHCAAFHPDGLPDESVVVSGDGGLAGVFVYLSDAPRSDGAQQPPAMIDQLHCQYVPHAVGVQINQLLRVHSSDAVLHNVHILAVQNPPANLSQTEPGEQIVRFAQPEFMPVRCDVHPWMHATVGVFDNPYFAVSSDDGKFTITNVPPGAYTVKTWHERLGTRTQRVVLSADGSATANFSYAP